MVRIVVNHDLVRIPQPIAAIADVVWRNAKEETAKPKTAGTSVGEMPNVPAPYLARKAPVLPREVEMIVRIIGPGVMPNPSIALNFDVGGLRVARFLCEVARLRAMLIRVVWRRWMRFGGRV